MQFIISKVLASEFEVDDLRNLSVSLSLTLVRNEKVEHYIRIKIHKLIVLRFWVESDVNTLYGWTQISLVFVLLSKTLSINVRDDCYELGKKIDTCSMTKSDNNLPHSEESQNRLKGQMHTFDILYHHCTPMFSAIFFLASRIWILIHPIHLFFSSELGAS